MDAKVSIKLKKNVDLKKYSTFKIGGKASYFVEVKSTDELKQALFFAKQKRVPIFVLGGGSNILLPDKTLKALVIKIDIKGIDLEGEKVWVGAGANWDLFVKKTLDEGLFGLENLSGIPGTVGASPIQNIGAYGVEVSKFIKKVETIDKESLKIKVFSNRECKFSYRDSFFKTKTGKNFVITRVLFLLSKKPQSNINYKDLKNYFGNKKPTPAKVRKAILKIRAGKFPNLQKYGTAGSFFHNSIITKKKYTELKGKYSDLPGFPAKSDHIKIPVAYIIDRVLNLKGFRLGDVGVYKNHALVLVNYKNAKQKDILKLKKLIEKKVFNKTKIKIKPEVTLVK